MSTKTTTTTPTKDDERSNDVNGFRKPRYVPETALHTAIFNSMESTMKYDEMYIQWLLKEKNVDPNRIKDGLTPLSCATMFGHTSLVQMLLEYGANPNLQHPSLRDGMAPLHWTGPWGRDDVAEILLQHGADPLLKMQHGWTPLHCATHTCADDVVAALLLTSSSSSDSSSSNNNGRRETMMTSALNDGGETPLSMARGKGEACRRTIYRQLMIMRLQNKSHELELLMNEGDGMK